MTLLMTKKLCVCESSVFHRHSFMVDQYMLLLANKTRTSVGFIYKTNATYAGYMLCVQLRWIDNCVKPNFLIIYAKFSAIRVFPVVFIRSHVCRKSKRITKWIIRASLATILSRMYHFAKLILYVEVPDDTCIFFMLASTTSLSKLQILHRIVL